MNKSGFLRRVVILGAFAYFYDRFVIRSGLFPWSQQVRAGLEWLLYAAVAYAIVTLLADRLKRTDTKEDQKEDDQSQR